MKDKFILDSSLWIEIERGNAKVLERISPLIAKNQICLADVIAAEVLRGVRSRKDFIKLKNAFSDFNQLSTKWDGVAELAFACAQKGFHPPLIDLYIADCAIKNDKTLLTQDKHFTHIARVANLKCELV